MKNITNIDRKLLEDVDAFVPLTEAFHIHLIDLLRRYYFVGGMPEAVKHFAETGNGRETRKAQEEIIKSYVLDFAKHAPATDIPKLTRIWDSIPKNLARENKKFVFSAVKKGARGRAYENALTGQMRLHPQNYLSGIMRTPVVSKYMHWMLGYWELSQGHRLNCKLQMIAYDILC